MMKIFRDWPNNLPVWVFKFAINCWPPYLGAGIKVTKIAADYRLIEVKMKLHWYNRNYIGTHFGGSLFAMADPFFMLMLLKNLGRDYIVWDKAASIDFIKASREPVTAQFTFTQTEIDSIRLQADVQPKYIFDRQVNIIDRENNVIATVTKTLYVRKKERAKLAQNNQH